MRKEPETLTALARPLMSSAMRVEMTIDASESSASTLMVRPVRTSTEFRKLWVSEGKKRCMVCILDYPW